MFEAFSHASEAERYRQLGQGAQKPSIMIVACCDSRAAPETIFDAGPGEMFVVRNVANLAPPYEPDGRHHSTSAALEFAVLSLKVKHIVIMGHGRCGGIQSVIDGNDPLSTSDFIGRWMSGVRDVAALVPRTEPERVHDHGMEVERASIRHSLANLRTFPWVHGRETSKDLSTHGVWFDISLGELHVYDESADCWSVARE